MVLVRLQLQEEFQIKYNLHLLASKMDRPFFRYALLIFRTSWTETSRNSILFLILSSGNRDNVENEDSFSQNLSEYPVIVKKKLILPIAQ